MRKGRERGAVAVEAAMIVGLLVLIAIGAVEYGLAFNNYFGLAASSREAARVGASIGQGNPSNSEDADCRILEAAAAALNSTSNAEVVSVTIAEWDETNQIASATVRNKYRPYISGDETDNPALLRCNAGWFELAHGWAESTREPISGPAPWIAINVEFEHHWTTGFLWWNGSAYWDNQNVMRIEPVTYG